jgi:hypothetical protein
MFLSTCESDNLYEFFLVQKHILLNFLVNKSHHFIYTFYWSLCLNLHNCQYSKYIWHFELGTCYYCEISPDDVHEIECPTEYV